MKNKLNGETFHIQHEPLSGVNLDYARSILSISSRNQQEVAKKDSDCSSTDEGRKKVSIGSIELKGESITSKGNSIVSTVGKEE